MEVAVVITTINRKAFLLRAIQSVVEQSFCVNELVIVDDGSKEEERLTSVEVEELKARCIKQKIKIRMLYNEYSKGGNFSRNLGVAASESEIIMFLDDDDFWCDKKVEDQLRFFIDVSIGLVYTGKKFVNDNKLNKVFRKSKENTKTKSIWSGNFIGSTSGVALRRSIFELAGGFDEKLGSLQDFDLWIRVLRLTNAVWDSKFNLIYTIHTGSGKQISSNTNKHIETVRYLLNKYREDLEKLTLVQRRHLLSRLNHVIARSYRKNNDLRFIFYFGKSLILFPTLRTLSLIIKA